MLGKTLKDNTKGTMPSVLGATFPTHAPNEGHVGVTLADAEQAVKGLPRTSV